MYAFYKVLKRFPFVVALLAAALFYYFAQITSEELSDLLLNISASLFTIPIVIYSYELIKGKILAESNKDVSEYVKMNVDRELLSLLDRVSPLVVRNVAPGLEKVLVFMGLDKAKIKQNLLRTTPIVFNLATDWSVSEKQFSDLLSNELIYNNMTVSERNMLIRLIKATRTMDVATDPRFYEVAGEIDSNLRVIRGEEIDQVVKFKNRYLLLKKSKRNNEFRVAAFNDINENKYKVDLLTPMNINADGQLLLLNALQEIKSCVNLWLDTRGDDFILDSHVFRMRRKQPVRGRA